MKATTTTDHGLLVEHHGAFTATYLYGHLTALLGGPLADRLAMSDQELFDRSTIASVD